MTRSPRAQLYTPEMLGLAVELAQYPLDPNAPAQGYARSRTCGSEVWVSGRIGSTDNLSDLGMRVVACAVGQASAALFARYALGQPRDDIASMLHGIGNWLEGAADSSILQGLDLLEGAREHSSRHEAILLPWRAAVDALSKGGAGR